MQEGWQIRTSDPRIVCGNKSDHSENRVPGSGVTYVIDFIIFLVRKEDSNKRAKYL